MTYGKEGYPTSRSLALWAEFLEDLAEAASSKPQIESEPATATNKTTEENSKSGDRTSSVHEEFLTLAEYFNHPQTDRHFVKDFGEWQHNNGEFYTLHYVTSAKEFVVAHTDKHHLPRGFVLNAYCSSVEKAKEALPKSSPAFRGSLQMIIEVIERAFPR